MSQRTPLHTALRLAPPYERAGLGLTSAYTVTLLSARLVAFLARRAASKPASDSRRVHHFVPGIGLVLTTAMAAVFSRDDGYELLLSLPLGAGAALTLAELELLLERSNPYWGSEKLALAQGTASALAACALAVRIGRRIES